MNKGPFVSGGHDELGTSEDAVASPSAPCAHSLLENQTHSSHQSECFEETIPSMTTNGNGSPLSFSIPSDNPLFESPSSDIVVDLTMGRSSSLDTTVLHHPPLPTCADIGEMNVVRREGGNNKTERTAVNEDPSRDDVIIANAVAVNDMMADAQMINEQANTPISQRQVWWQKKYLLVTGIIFIVAAFAITATLLVLYLKTKSNPVPDKITPLPSTHASLPTPSTPAYLPTPSTPSYLHIPSKPTSLAPPSTPASLPTPSTPASFPTPSTPAYLPTPSTPTSLPTFQTIKVGADGKMTFQVYAAVIGNKYNSTEVIDNTDYNNILEDFQKGFVGLALQVANANNLSTIHASERDDDLKTTDVPGTATAPSQKLRKRDTERQLLQMTIQRDLYDISYLIGENLTTQVWDVECPSGLTFVPEGAPCLEVDFTVTPPDLTPTQEELLLSFSRGMMFAIADGDLYAKIAEFNPNTWIDGVGVPSSMALHLPSTPTSLSTFQTTKVGADGKMTVQVYAAVIDNNYNSTEVINNTDNNNVLEDMQMGFVLLALQVANMDNPPTIHVLDSDDTLENTEVLGSTMAPSQKRQKRFTDRQLLQMTIQRQLYDISFLMDGYLTTEVWDVECPSGLTFAPEGAPCLKFEFSITSLDLTSSQQEFLLPFAQAMMSALADGELYTEIVELNPNTLVDGVGVPG